MVAPGPASTTAPPLTAPQVVPSLEKGKLYHVDLTAADETTVAKQLAAQPTIQAQGSTLVPLPGAYRLLASDGVELTLKPFVIAQKLAFNQSMGMFVTTIAVGVHEISGPAPPKSLSAPISFQVLNADAATPEELLVSHSGAPLGKIKVAVAQAVGGPTVTVASPFDPEGVPVPLSLAPTFSLSVTKSFDGLGLEAAPITVLATGLAKAEGQIVQLTVDGPARPDADELQLNKDGRASTKLRSVGVGGITVHAQLEGFPPIQTGTMAALPLLTIASSILGGIVGGLIRLLPGLQRNTTRRFWLGLVVAVLVAIIVFGLYAVGVNVLPFQPTVQQGAVVVFVISGMGAFLGSGILGSAKTT